MIRQPHAAQAVSELVTQDLVRVSVGIEHIDDLRDAFTAFLERVPFYGACVLCADDPEVRSLAARLDRKVVTYGLAEGADVRGEPMGEPGSVNAALPTETTGGSNTQTQQTGGTN